MAPASRPGERPAIEGGPVDVARDEPLRRELADFVEAVRAGRPPVVTGGRPAGAGARDARGDAIGEVASTAMATAKPLMSDCHVS